MRKIRRDYRRFVRTAQAAARDGMRAAVLLLAAMLVFAHPGPQETLVAAAGLAGIFCARLTRRPAGSRSASPGQPAPGQPAPGQLPASW